MKRILIISGIQIFPAQSGGQLRCGNLARSLARAGHEVSIYSFTGRKADYLARVPSSEQTIALGLTEYVDRSFFRGLLQFLTYRLNLPNLWMSVPASCPEALRERMNESDIVVIDLPFPYPYLRFAGFRPRIINSQNVEGDVEFGKGRLRNRILKALVRHVESRAAASADAVFACGPDDRRYYEAEGRGRLKVVSVPNALDLGSVEAVSAEKRSYLRKSLGIGADDKVILYLASKWGPNREGFEFLRVFERAHRARLTELGVTFLVVGSVAEEAHQEGRLVTTGFVPDTKPFFPAADYAINPVVSGSGTNVKMFEYLVRRMPILSTEFGTRGFDLKAGEDYVRFGKGDFLEVLERLPSSEESTLMGESAYRKNRGLCDMDAVVREAVEPLVRELTSGRGPARGAPGSSPRPLGSAVPT